MQQRGLLVLARRTKLRASQVRRRNQTGSMIGPQPRFAVCGICWMYRASITLLLVRLISTLIHDCCRLPLHLGSIVLCTYCNPVLLIISLYCSPVFSQLLLKCSPCFANVHMVTLTAGHLYTTAFFFKSAAGMGTLTFTIVLP